MKNRQDRIRVPQHFRSIKPDIGANQRKNVGAALQKAKKRLLIKRIVMILLLLLLVVAVLVFVFSDWFDVLIQKLIQEIG